MRLPTKRRCTATHSSFGVGNGELSPGTRTVRKSVKPVLFRAGDFVAMRLFSQAAPNLCCKCVADELWIGSGAVAGRVSAGAPRGVWSLAAGHPGRAAGIMPSG